MPDCNNKYQFGRNALLEIAIQCQGEDPALTTFLPLGAVTTKGFNMEGNVVEINDSSNSSGFTQNQISSSSLTGSVSGNKVRNSNDFPNVKSIAALKVHYFNSVKQDLSGEPVVLIRLSDPELTLTAYMLITSIGDDMADADLSTWSMELALAVSPEYPPTLVLTA